MKKTRTRFLSMLLALVMVVTILPTGLFTLTAKAEGDDTGWILIGNHDGISKSDPEWWADLCTYLSEKDITYKIRLTEDIELEDGDEGKHCSVGIHGNKTLDMNGYNLTVHLNGFGEHWWDPDSATLFYVWDEAVFTLDDSTGNNGRIFFNGYLEEYGSPKVRDVFDVYGTMIMNGGFIRGGRSKRSWETQAKNYGRDSEHTGYVRKQTNGNGITVYDGGNLVVNGGEIGGRGYQEWSKKVTEQWNAEFEVYESYDRCAAVRAKDGSMVLINDGYLVGQGGADALRADEGADVAVMSGHFKVRRLDRIIIGTADSDGAGYFLAYMSGDYGDVGVTNDMLNGRARIVSGGEVIADTSAGADEEVQDEKSVYVEPYDEAYRVNGTLTVTDSLQDNSNTWRIGSSMNISVAYQPYFTDESREYLKNDYYDSSDGDVLYTWTLQDKDRKAVSKPYQLFWPGNSYTLDLKDIPFVDTNGNAVTYTSGETYFIHIEANEYWKSTHKYSLKPSYEVILHPTSLELPEVTSFVKQTYPGTGKYPGGGSHENAEFIFGPSQETIAALDALVTSSKISKWSYVTAGHYDVCEGEGDTAALIGKIQYAGCEYGETYVSPQAGAQMLATRFFITELSGKQNSNLVIYDDVFAMPPTKSSTDGTTYTKVTGSKIDPASNGVYLSAEIDGLMTDGFGTGIDDPVTGENISLDSLSWQMFDKTAEAWVTVTDTIGQYTIDPTTKIIHIYRAGLYRACFTYGGKEFYSPITAQVGGTDYETNQQCWADSGNMLKDFGDEKTVELKRNTANAKWGSDFTYYLVVKSTPAGGNAVIGNSSIVQNNNPVFDTDKVFKAGTTAATVIPGTYTFDLIVQDNTYGGRYHVANYLSVTYRKQASSFDIYCDGKNVTKNTATGSYTMAGNTNICNLSGGLYPTNSTYPSQTYTYSSGNTSIATVDAKGNVIALRPGTAVITVTPSTGVSKTVSIVVPIAGFTIEKPVFTVGEKYEDVVPVISSVWSYNGIKITNGASNYLTASARSLDGDGFENGAAAGKVIAYNETGEMLFLVRPTENYQFPLYMTDYNSGNPWYKADDTMIATNAFGDSSLPKTAYQLGCYGSDSAEGGYRVGYSGDTGHSYNAALFVPYELEVVRDPNARYIDTITVTTAEPAVGDSRYLGKTNGTSTNSNNFLNTKINTLSALTVDGYPNAQIFSVVTGNSAKLITAPTGSGVPYENAASDYNSTNADLGEVIGVQMDVINNGYTDKVYTAGTYVHDLSIWGGSISDGVTYYFSPDVQVYVNGHKVELNSYAADKLYMYYYYNVGTVPSYTDAVIDGVTAPAVGVKPVASDKATVRGNKDMDVTRLTWFIDRDGDKVLDDIQYDTNGNITDYGEVAGIYYDSDGKYDKTHSTLAEDGTFLGNTVYSVLAEVSANTVDCRIDTDNFALKLNDSGTDKTIGVLSTSGTYTYAKTDKTVIKSFTADLEGVTVGYSVMGYPLTSTPDGMHLSSYCWWRTDTNTLESGTLQATSYTFEVFYVADEGYEFDPNIIVTIGGKVLTSGVSVDNSNPAEPRLRLVIPFDLSDSAGVTVSGTATSFGASETEQTTIQLYSGTGDSIAAEAAYETTVIGTGAKGYSVAGVMAGTYTVKVMKLNHVTRTYEITVGTDTVTQDVKIHLKGDISGDGRITTIDFVRANSHARGVTLLTEYELLCADVVGTDGSITTADAMRINAHAKGTSLLW